ncbi:MAG: response regulator [Gemmatimonadota bacterium]|nr:response regulator [Gemmatimonadota bacterium]
MADDVLAARLLSIFIEELDEEVRQLNDDLLALERTPNDSERLRAVFRVMHTLKGASRAAGLLRVEEVCHALENELSRVRDGGEPLTPVQIALLFEAADALGETRDELRLGRPAPEATLSIVLHHARGRGAAERHAAPPDSAPATRHVVASTAPIVAAAQVESAVPSTPVAPPLPPAPAPTARPEDAASRAENYVRVSLHQVEAIAGAAGEIAGLVGVLSDRADELSALRARHRAELRTSASTGGAGLDGELTRLLRRTGDDARTLASVSERLGNSARSLRQRPFAELTETLPRIARDVARDVAKQVHVTIVGSEIEADRVVLEALREPLLHLVRNAIDHGIESPAVRTAAGKPAEGELRVEGALRGDRLVVTVSDDGAGLDMGSIAKGLARRGHAVATDPRVLARAIFDEGFTTRDTATTLSGRGVGLGIVRAAAERMGGTADVRSVAGKGTQITIDVPLSIATMRVVLVQVGEIVLGVPSAFVVRVTRVDPKRIVRVDGRPTFVTDDAPMPVTTLAALLGPPFSDSPTPAMLQVVVLENSSHRVAIVVDDLHDERELVLRPLEHAGPAATNVVVGTALLSSGEVALVLNVPALLAHDGGGGHHSGPLAVSESVTRPPARVLVVDDSITSRTLEQSVLTAAGYDVVTAVDGAEAWRTIERQDFALVVSDVEMPHLDGIGLCQRIRATARTSALPLILVTSLDEPAQRERGMEAGADAYITKSSFDQDTLLDTVRMLIGRATGTT